MTKRSPTARPHADRIPRVPAGPLAPTVLGECSDWLTAQGYSRGSAAGIVNLLARLSVWMDMVDAGLDDLDEELLVPRQLRAEAVAARTRPLVQPVKHALEAVASLSAEISEGGDAYPVGVRELSRQLTDDTVSRLQTLNAILNRNTASKG